MTTVTSIRIARLRAWLGMPAKVIESTVCSEKVSVVTTFDASDGKFTVAAIRQGTGPIVSRTNTQIPTPDVVLQRSERTDGTKASAAHAKLVKRYAE